MSFLRKLPPPTCLLPGEFQYSYSPVGGAHRLHRLYPIPGAVLDVSFQALLTNESARVCMSVSLCVCLCVKRVLLNSRTVEWETPSKIPHQVKEQSFEAGRWPMGDNSFVPPSFLLSLLAPYLFWDSSQIHFPSLRSWTLFIIES